MLTSRVSFLDRLNDWGEENLQPYWLSSLALASVIGYLGAFAWAWQNTSYDLWGAMLIAPVLLALTVPMARRAAADERDPTLVRLILGALALKLFMSLVRYAFLWFVYNGYGDAKNYHIVGRQLSRLFRAGDFSTMGEALSGTGFMRVFTGALYTIIGPTMIGGFLVFAWLGFWGLYLWYRAFCLAVPGGDRRKYARLLFFLPSMLFWPSSIGKEAFMCFMLGMAAYGAAAVLTHRRGGFWYLAFGVAGAAIVRPHIALMIFVSLGVAYLVRRGQSHKWFGPLPKIAGIVGLVVAGAFLLGQVEEFLGVDSLQNEGAQQALAITSDRSEGGGSAFTTVPPTSPPRYAWVLVTVLFRPFPHEAGNIQALSAAAEGLVLMGLAVLALPRGRQLLRTFRRSSYPVLALTYVLLFGYAFSSVGNFGILTRQRVQVLPFLLVLLCMPRGEVAAAEPVPDTARAYG